MLSPQAALADTTATAAAAATDAGPAASHEGAPETSLGELLKLDLAFVGSPVRQLALDETVATDNPLELEARHLPASIDVMGRDTMTGRGIKNVVEATSNLGGVVSGESPGEPYSFGMRGFSHDSVMVLYDGVAMGEATLNMRPLSSYNLERIEVSKGPVVFHHGQAGAAGTINLIPRRPDPLGGTENNVILSLGRYGETSYSFESRAPLAKDLFYRAAFSRNGSNGWVSRSESETVDLQGALLWTPRANLDVTLSVAYARDQLPAYWGTPLLPRAVAREPITGLVDTSDGRVVDRAARFTNYNVVDHVLSSRSRWDRLDVEYHSSAQTGARLVLYHYGAERTWRNAESYSYDASSGLVERDRLYVHHDRAVYGATGTLTHTSAWSRIKNRVAFGLSYAINQFDRVVGFENDGVYAGDATSLSAPAPALFGSVADRPDSLDCATLAATLEDRIELDERLSLTGVVKAERVGIDLERYHVRGMAGSGRLDRAYDQAAYKAALSYELTPRFMGYAHWAHQHDLIQGDLARESVASLADFRPSTVEQLEGGLKAELLPGALESTLAIYHLEKSLRSQPQGAAPFDMRQSSVGAELALRAEVGRHLQLGGSAAWLRARFGPRYSFFGDDTGGKSPPYSPAFMANGWLSVRNFWDVPLELGAGAVYVSERPANGLNTVTLRPYSLVDLMASYTGRRYRIGVHARNVFDKIYAAWSDVNYPDQVLLSAPRTFEATLRVGL